MDLLPSEDEQAALLRELKELVREGGPAPLLAGPVLWASDRWFPDPFEGRPVDVARLLLRLLRYTELDELPVGLTLVEDLDTTAQGPLLDGTTPPARWTFGDDDVPILELGVSTLRDPDHLVGLLCRQVARLWRWQKDLCASELEQEEMEVDVTGVYLGFGPLLANAADLHRSEGGLEGTLAWSSWRRSFLGVLSPTSFAFLIATQVHLRDDAGLRRAVAGALQTNQRAAFDKALTLLKKEEPPVAERLVLGAKERWPSPRDVTHLTDPIDDEEALELLLEGDAPDGHGGEGEGEGPLRPTFRVEESSWLGFTIAGGFGGFIAGAGATVLTGEPLAMLAVAGGALVGGFFLGRSRRRLVCTDPDCNTTLHAGDERCPGCHRPVVRTLRSRDERLEAEEEWRRQRRLAS